MIDNTWYLINTITVSNSPRGSTFMCLYTIVWQFFMFSYVYDWHLQVRFLSFPLLRSWFNFPHVHNSCYWTMHLKYNAHVFKTCLPFHGFEWLKKSWSNRLFKTIIEWAFIISYAPYLNIDESFEELVTWITNSKWTKINTNYDLND